MALPPQVTGLSREDLPDAPPWIDRLLPKLNQALKGGANALNRQLTFADNFAAEIRDITVTIPDDWVTPTLKANVANWGGGFATIQYRKKADGTVEIKGFGRAGAALGAFYTCYTLDIPYRISETRRFAGEVNDVAQEFEVNSDGSVKLGNNGAANTNHFTLEATFTASDRTPIAPAVWSKIGWKTSLTGKPAGIWPIAIADSAKVRARIPPTVIDWEWRGADNNIRILNMPGLIPTRSYKITLLAIQG